jgi:hypothetical protein
MEKTKSLNAAALKPTPKVNQIDFLPPPDKLDQGNHLNKLAPILDMSSTQ